MSLNRTVVVLMTASIPDGMLLTKMIVRCLKMSSGHDVLLFFANAPFHYHRYQRGTALLQS
jgi:hypothetical protein